jgi:hypothetical protein
MPVCHEFIERIDLKSPQKKGFTDIMSVKPFDINVVQKAGLEPARVSPLPPQDSVSTKFHHFGTCTIRISKE